VRVGIDIGGNHISAGIVEDNGKIIAKQNKDIDFSKMSHSEEKSQQIIIETIEEEIDSLLKVDEIDLLLKAASKDEQKIVEQIGIAAPGNPSATALRNLVNLKIKNFEIGKVLAEKYGAEVKIKNDGKCAGLAEKRYGALRGYEDCIFLCVGTGIGSAVFLRGKLLEPRLNTGFELGHIVVDRNQEKCSCGNTGCWETLASMKTFREKAIKELKLDATLMETKTKLEEALQTSKELNGGKAQQNGNVVPEKIQKYIRENQDNEEVDTFLTKYIDDFSIGLANLINIFEPEAIAFGGSFSYYGDIFIPRIKKQIKKYLFNKDTSRKFLVGELKNDAGIIGAAELFNS